VPTWREVLKSIQDELTRANAQARGAIDTIRRDYLKKLHEHTKRNIVAYYSAFLSKPGIQESGISDEDKNGFMMAVHGVDRKSGLDLILHTQGGSIAATESIVQYLRKIFGHDIRAIVPPIAMSAGTMIACSCKAILMSSKHSNLGPIDPYLRGFPAYGVIQEFKRACKEVKQDASRIPIWQPIIRQYEPTFLSQCENAIKWSNKFVGDQLIGTMFAGDTKARDKARKVVRHLTDFSGNRTHERHIHFDECKTIGLKVEAIEDDQDLQDLVLTVHHCFMHTMTNTNAFKIIENHLGAAFVKQ
jgi:ATP-dependent protease ClpP protease subunit